MRVQQAVWEEMNGLSTHEESVAARHTDVAAALANLLQEKTLMLLEQTGEAQIAALWQLWLATNADINIPVGAIPMLGQAAPQQAPGTGGYEPKPPATVAGNGARPGG
mgnify:CR=1 FL=1